MILIVLAVIAAVSTWWLLRQYLRGDLAGVDDEAGDE